MPQKLTIPFSIIGFTAFIWVCASAFGTKADKTETETLRTKVIEIEKAHALLTQKIDYVIRDTTDANSKLDFIIKEILRSRSGDQQPPGATPSPLNR